MTAILKQLLGRAECPKLSGFEFANYIPVLQGEFHGPVDDGASIRRREIMCPNKNSLKRVSDCMCRVARVDRVLR